MNMNYTKRCYLKPSHWNHFWFLEYKNKKTDFWLLFCFYFRANILMERFTFYVTFLRYLSHVYTCQWYFLCTLLSRPGVARLFLVRGHFQLFWIFLGPQVHSKHQTYAGGYWDSKLFWKCLCRFVKNSRGY